MTLNTSKCKVMQVTRKMPHSHNYTLNGNILETVPSYKYLGVIISSNLSWEPHINYITNNANRTLGYLKRNFSGLTSTLKLQLYKTLVRPKLEYAASIWDPGLAYLISSVESVQNRSARFILSKYHRTASVTAMKSQLQLPDLSLRRLSQRLCLLHKIFYHSVLHNLLLSSPSFISRRLDHRHKIEPIHCNGNSFYYSFLPQAITHWNRLPEPLVLIRDNQRFRSAVTTHICSHS